jgi:hypothetical protein
LPHAIAVIALTVTVLGLAARTLHALIRSQRWRSR